MSHFSATFFAMHAMASSGIDGIERSNSEEDHANRIIHIELLTYVALPKMREFYEKKLGLPVLEDRPNRLSIQAGLSTLTFTPANAIDGKPFYHFAFNIPQNKIKLAREWQLKRTPLLPIPPQLRDPEYPVDVVNYSHWNAHSVFFFDPAGNVVEYIARHDIKNSATGPYTPKDILCISEIAFVSDDVATIADKLKETAGVTQYRGGSDQFMALGDENGLLLVMKRGRIISFDAPEKKAVSVFGTHATVSGKSAGKLALPGYPYTIDIKSK
ncbi:MAG: glyoxalase/bleomycin resistance/dioxygenase family protein [Chthonomonadales bacterium]